MLVMGDYEHLRPLMCSHAFTTYFITLVKSIGRLSQLSPKRFLRLNNLVRKFEGSS